MGTSTSTSTSAASVPVYLYRLVGSSTTTTTTTTTTGADYVVGLENFTATVSSYCNISANCTCRYERVDLDAGNADASTDARALFHVLPAKDDLIPPESGMWPLDLWYSAVEQRHVISGSPDSNVEVNNMIRDPSKGFKRQYRIGWSRPLPDGCYFGLPSVAFGDPAFATPGGFVYWRGRAWGPLAMLVYWGLAHPAYANVSSVTSARQGLAKAWNGLFMDTAWRRSHTVCENYNVAKAGGCTGDSFYHWGATAGFMSIVEAGYWEKHL